MTHTDAGIHLQGLLPKTLSDSIEINPRFPLYQCERTLDISRDRHAGRWFRLPRAEMNKMNFGRPSDETVCRSDVLERPLN